MDVVYEGQVEALTMKDCIRIKNDAWDNDNTKDWVIILKVCNLAYKRFQLLYPKG